jgi:hypothetical protein
VEQVSAVSSSLNTRDIQNSETVQTRNMLLVATLNFAHAQNGTKLDFGGIPITQIYLKFWKFILEVKLIALGLQDMCQ